MTAWALCLLLLCAALACGHAEPEDARPSVVVTIFPQYDFIRAIAGDLVKLEMLVKPGSEVHGFDPTFAEVSTILHADLFVYVGGESDRWTEDVLNRSDHAVNAISLLEVVDALDEETVEGMQAEEEEDEDEPEFLPPIMSKEEAFRAPVYPGGQRGRNAAQPGGEDR